MCNEHTPEPWKWKTFTDGALRELRGLDGFVIGIDPGTDDDEPALIVSPVDAALIASVPVMRSRIIELEKKNKRLFGLLSQCYTKKVLRVWGLLDTESENGEIDE